MATSAPPTTLDAIASRLKIRVLRHLATREGAQSGRAIARALGSDPTKTSAALRELADAGLVERRRMPPAYLYSINRRNYLVDRGLLPAFEAEQQWAEALGDDVRSLARREIVSVILYGSTARGEAGPGSDVDLALVVRQRRDRRRVEDVMAQHYGALHDRYGRPVSFLVLDREDFRRRVAHGDQLARDILDHGRVVAGAPTARLLVGKSTSR